MKWTLLAVGRVMPPPIRELVEEYGDRLRHFIPLRLESVAEEKRDKNVTPRLAMEREGQRLRSRCPATAWIVALDGSGQSWSSLELSRQVEQWIQAGHSEVVFVIGGPDGLDPVFKSSAHQILSLGPMTYPHMLVRVLILEQLYRAMTLLRGVPYHR
ncbi:MAG: 23S rRNA (pseudouridine(1915)-N(3))-methyltransferase RlmH [Magnetococcales bacterium]|nr:23S rRNA (pseudouridine(1915)-N(3))-methyltransferase RlmH [Magnetococcales bacterium]NGZ07500.1 23S rRNA (pseudouridine(1915)-N(3))-methyltransferase RlmH [Magnetococcales bacterium]